MVKLTAKQIPVMQARLAELERMTQPFTVGAICDSLVKERDTLKARLNLKWHGDWPAQCDLCQRPLEQVKWFADAYVPGQAWGLVCPMCFASYGCRLGTGAGQKFDSKSLVKLEG